MKEADQAPALEYVKALEKSGKFQLCIWPEHCIIGTDGHNVTPPVNEGLNTWVDSTHGAVDWILKGQNVHTEMYSALQAEVVVPGDQSTGDNISGARFGGRWPLCSERSSTP